MEDFATLISTLGGTARNEKFSYILNRCSFCRRKKSLLFSLSLLSFRGSRPVPTPFLAPVTLVAGV